jgi:hypothetical protein
MESELSPEARSQKNEEVIENLNFESINLKKI